MACVKLGGKPGHEYMFRERAEGKNAVTEIFGKANANFKDLTPEQLADAKFAQEELPFAGELYMGHLRYSTTGKSGIQYVHPFLRRNNWKAKNLCLCGNFNMTNTADLNESLIAIGQHPIFATDTQALLEKIGFFLDEEHEDIYRFLRTRGILMTGNVPKQRYMDRGYFRVIQSEYMEAGGAMRLKTVTRVREKGVDFIRRQLHS